MTNLNTLQSILFLKQTESEFMHWISDDKLLLTVILLSMAFQVVLAFLGSFRHCSSNPILQFALWLAYMCADSLAIYALGNMAKDSASVLFGIFAPLLLIHLGGPDTITAYSTNDNELWTRHMVIMLFQNAMAFYIIYVSGLEGRLLVAAILFAIVGATKYAERTKALRHASFSQIVSSAQPIYKYMSIVNHGESCKYMVMGATQWERESEGAKRSEEIVDIHDFWKKEGKGAKRRSKEKETKSYMLCLSMALFKMYKRRYVNLYLHERGKSNTRRFFLGEPIEFHPPFSDMKISSLTVDKLFVVIEMELKFLYDALFTKSSGTAYNKWGVMMRLGNIILLGIAWFITVQELRNKHEFLDEALSAQRAVAYIVVSVGFFVEVLQLLRIMTSDWTLVWLICYNIRNGRKGQNFIQCWIAKLMKFVTRKLSKVWEIRERKYWKREIQQYCIEDKCKQIHPLIWNWSGYLSYFHLRDLIIRWHIHASPIDDDLEEFIVEQVKERCPPEADVEACKNELTNFTRSFKRKSKYESLPSFSGSDQEHLILHWHVATTICEKEYNMDETKDKRYFEISRKLSRYCVYLLVMRPKLLPLHPDIAKMEYMKLHNELIDLIDFAPKYDLAPKYAHMVESESTLAGGVRLAYELFKIGKENKQELWEVIAHHWAEVLICYAVSGKSTEHAKYLTVGGEFLTHLWVLIGHLGCGNEN